MVPSYIIARPPVPLPEDDIRSKCQSLTGTKYKKFSYREHAPAITDCLTAVEYIYREKLQMQLDYIGNMPRHLEQQGWSLLKVNPTEIKPGDLLFLGDQKKLVSHVGIVIPDEKLKIFHSSFKKEGAAIEPLSALLEEYKAPENIDDVLSYKSPKGTLLKNPQLD